MEESSGIVENESISSSSSSSCTEIVSDFSEAEDWIEPLAKSLVDIHSPHFQPALALRLAPMNEGNLTGIIPETSSTTSVPKYLNLATYAKAVPDPSQSPDLSYQFQPRVLGKKHKPKAPNAAAATCISSSSTSTSVLSTSTSKSTSKSAQAQCQPVPQPDNVAAPPEVSTEPDYPIPGRRFLAHQLPVYAPRVQPPDTVKVMATVEGPLGALRVAMQAKKRVKVWTRRDVGIRGYLTGFIEAFDKHWNLALRDVDEVFWRRRRLKGGLEELGVGGDYQNQDQRSTTTRIDSLQKAPPPPLPPQPPQLIDNMSGGRIGRKSREDKKILPPSSPTKRSKRIAARSRSQTRRETLEADSSQDLVNWCRRKIKNLSIKDTPKKNDKSPASFSNPSGDGFKSKSYERKHGLTNFSQPLRDANGFVIVGVTGRVEIVERHVGQLFVMGNDIVMVETMT